jgi:hypothetical protein
MFADLIIILKKNDNKTPIFGPFTKFGIGMRRARQTPVLARPFKGDKAAVFRAGAYANS